MFFVVAELNNVILEFTDVKAVMKAEGPVSAVPVNYHLHHPRTFGTGTVTWEYRGQIQRG